GYQHAKYMLTNQFHYYCLDYMLVNFVNDRGHYISRYVKTADLEVILKKLKIKYDPQHLTRQRVLIIPDKGFMELLHKRDRRRLDDFNIIIKDEVLQHYSSNESTPQEYYMRF